MHTCKSKLFRKKENEEIISHVHKTQDMLSRKPFWEKTQIEGKAASLSFSVWKYGYRYKELMSTACGLLQCIDTLCLINLISLLAIFSHIWNKFSRKNGMPLPPSGLVITQPDSILTVKFDYIKF